MENTIPTKEHLMKKYITREEFETMKEWVTSIAKEVNKIASWADYTADKLNDRFEKLDKPEENVKLS